MTIGQRRPGRREARVEVERAPRVAEPNLGRLGRGGKIGMTTPEKLEMRLRMYGWTPGELGGFGRRQLDRNLPRHRFCQLALQAEHVLQLTIVAASPERFVGPCGD